jgi:hypothetical protein
MKKMIVVLFVFASTSAAFAQSLVSVNPVPAVSFSPENAAFNWILTSYDFGKIKVNNPVSYEFSFTNTGDIPLVISSVKASCGCTVASYTKDPIPVGGQGYVKATYNAASIGKFTKTVTVNANTEEGVVTLSINGEVVQ